MTCIKNSKFSLAWLIPLLIPCAATQAYSAEAKTDEARPNIILLMGDDHGANEVGYNGHPYVKTPVLDSMSKSGLRFDRFYAAHPTCSPTRGSTLTGRHPNRYGTFGPNWSLRPEEFTIAHLLKNAGYATGHFGKWHVGPIKKESPTSPGAMGFDEWFSHDNFFEIDPIVSRNGEPPAVVKGESSEILVDETIRFIKDSTSSNEPFFALVWFGSPHSPYRALPQDLALYDAIPGIPDGMKARYAEITAMDRAIGKLRTYLAENNLKENTLFMYVGDNGSPGNSARVGNALRRSKGSMYEGGIRVPSVLEWPKVIQQPAVTQAIAVTTDYLQTLAEITGQRLPNRPLDGMSWLPIFKDSSIERNRPHFFWQYNRDLFDDNCDPYIDPELQEGTTPLEVKRHGKFTRTFTNCVYTEIKEEDFQGERVMMDDRYKLVVDGETPNAKGFELYDLLKDPGETQNLADAHPERVQAMATALRAWQESVLNSLTGADYGKSRQ
jgi:arylsulfatase A-like enzyme